MTNLGPLGGGKVEITIGFTNPQLTAAVNDLKSLGPIDYDDAFGQLLVHLGVLYQKHAAVARARMHSSKAERAKRREAALKRAEIVAGTS